MIKQSLNDHAAKMEDIEAVNRRNHSASMLKKITDTFDILNATFAENTKLHSNTLNIHLANVTNSSNEFLLKIDALEKTNEAMKHTIAHLTKILYGTIGLILIILVFSLVSVVHLRSRSCTVRETSPTDQLALETNKSCLNSTESL